MRTRRLHKASQEIASLVAFLKKRDYTSPHKLTYTLDNAEEQIERIVNLALDDTMKELERYIEEAYLWSENRMTNFDGTPEKISKREQAKSATELKRLRRAKLALLQLRF